VSDPLKNYQFITIHKIRKDRKTEKLLEICQERRSQERFFCPSLTFFLSVSSSGQAVLALFYV
jgi:hypothetical protein